MSPYDHIAEARRISFEQTGQYLSDSEILSSTKPTQSNSGGDTDYYRIPANSTMLQDLIEFKDMSWNQANIFKAAYRLGDPQTHSSIERDLNKIIWFAQRMLNQLPKESNGHH